MKVVQQYLYLLAGFLITASWLIPNHYIPWTTFHSDATSAMGFCLLLLVATWSSSSKKIEVNSLHFALLALTLLTISYKFFWNVTYKSQVLIPAMYLLGFVLASFVGQMMKKVAPSVLDVIIYIPPLVASVVSVGLQMAQWLAVPDYGLTDVWISESSGIRPAANLNQPNQLASLLLWGLLSSLWLYKAKKIEEMTVLGLTVFLCFGIGLTLSRTSIIGFLFISVYLAICNRQRLRLPHFVGWLFAAATIYLAWKIHTLVPYILGISDVFNTDVDAINRGGAVRFSIWEMFISAILEKPLIGYGPLMTLSAQFEQMSEFPELGGGLYSSAHNLLLDLAIWYGLPIALFVCGVFLYWFLRVMRLAVDQEFHRGADILVSMILVMLIHASLELPLHHAYFLLPTGLIIGALMTAKVMPFTSLTFKVRTRAFLLVGALIGVFIFSIVAEYVRLERQVNYFRFKVANILNTPNPEVPNLWILDQLSDQLWFNMLPPDSRMSEQELQRAKLYVNSYKYCGTVAKYYFLMRANNETEATENLRVKLLEKCPNDKEYDLE